VRVGIRTEIQRCDVLNLRTRVVPDEMPRRPIHPADVFPASANITARAGRCVDHAALDSTSEVTPPYRLVTTIVEKLSIPTLGRPIAAHPAHLNRSTTLGRNFPELLGPWTLTREVHPIPIVRPSWCRIFIGSTGKPTRRTTLAADYINVRVPLLCGIKCDQLSIRGPPRSARGGSSHGSQLYRIRTIGGAYI